MNDEFFDHIKHRLAETPVPDPEQAWKQMRTLLDAEAVAPRRPFIRSLSPWWQAAACVLVVATAWALYHHWSVARERIASVRMKADAAARAADSGNDAGTAIAPGALANNDGTPADGSAPNSSGATSTNGGTAISSTFTAPYGGGTGAHASGNPSGTSTLSATQPFSRSGASHPGGLASTQTPFTHGLSSTPNAFTNTTIAGQALFAHNPRISGDQSENGTPPPGEASPTGGSAPSVNLSLSLTDGRFLQDRPSGAPFVAGRQRSAVSVNVSEPLHIHSPLHIPRLGLNIGLAANLPGSFRRIKTNGQSSRLSPGIYPMAFLQYQVSPRWNLTLGVGAPSPVSYANMPTATDLYIAADTLQNSTQTTTSQKITRLVYADIPLTVGYRVLRHLSLQAGVQLSCLLSQQDETTSVNTALRGAFIPLAYSATTAVYYPGNHDPLRATVAKIDPRGLLGVNYQLNRFSASLQYQGGLRTEISQTDEEGNPVNSRTSTVRMLIGYRLN